MTEAVLKIFYKGKKKPEAQGKVFKKGDEWIYLADMTPNKYIRNGDGYTIAYQILDALKDKNITIIYRRKDLKTCYKATRNLFLRKGWKVNWGNHEQQILAVESFEYSDYIYGEPNNLPSMTVDSWLKPPKTYDKPVSQDEYINMRLRLREEFRKHL